MTLIEPRAIRAALTIGPAAEKQIIDSLIPAVEADWAARTERLWEEQEEYEHRFRLQEWHIRGGLIWSPLMPITAITFVEWGKGETEDDAEEVEAEDVDVDTVSGRLTRVAGEWLPNVVATITGGYTSETLPPDIREALTQQVIFQYQRFKPDKLHVERESHGKGVSVEYVSGAHHPLYTKAITMYRRRAR
jgi:hypothetical protein